MEPPSANHIERENETMQIDLDAARAASPLRRVLVAALATLAVAGAAAAAPPAPETIYGRDDRVETLTLTGQRAKAARATVALVDVGSIRGNGDGTSTLTGAALGQRYNLCPGQRFAGQPTPAFCSGILLAPDVVATAGHCIDRSTLASTRFVLDLAMQDRATARISLPNRKIYRARRLLARQFAYDGKDYAIVQLDRRVGDRAPAALRRTGRVAKGAALYVIGHPSGLPAKFADHAWVQANGHPAYFEANLDTFAGNSGAPVFEANTHRVAGLLVRGDADYVPTSRGCYVPNVRPDRPGNEEITRATLFAPFVPVR
jgi:hypothetical protein